MSVKCNLQRAVPKTGNARDRLRHLISDLGDAVLTSIRVTFKTQPQFTAYLALTLR